MIAKLSIVSFIACMMAVLLAGCGSSGPERVNVSGTVSYKGKPIEDGAIELIPTGGGPMQWIQEVEQFVCD